MRVELINIQGSDEPTIEWSKVIKVIEGVQTGTTQLVCGERSYVFTIPADQMLVIHKTTKELISDEYEDR